MLHEKYWKTDKAFYKNFGSFYVAWYNQDKSFPPDALIHCSRCDYNLPLCGCAFKKRRKISKEVFEYATKISLIGKLYAG